MHLYAILLIMTYVHGGGWVHIQCMRTKNINTYIAASLILFLIYYIYQYSVTFDVAGYTLVH